MKKLLFFIGILAVSFAAFGQTYDGDKLPSGLTVTTSMQANDIQVVQKAGESYVKGIKAYHAYLYYKKMLDSIVNLSVANNLSVGGDLDVTDRIDANRIYASIGQFAALACTVDFACTANAYFTDYTEVQDTLFAYWIKTLPTDTIENEYALVLDPTDNIVKLAPMSGATGQPDFNNVVFVSYDLPANVPAEHKFKSYADAVVWINTNGSPTADNHWTIVMPSGYCDEEIVADEFIDIQGHVGTVISSISSKVICTGSNIYDATIKNCVIDTLFVDEAKILSVDDCVIYWVEPVNGAANGYLNINNCMILGGDFSNTQQIIPWKNITMLAVDDFVSLDSLNHGLQNSLIKATTGLPGITTTLPVCMYNCLITVNHAIEQEQLLIHNCTADIDSVTMLTQDFHVRNSSLNIDILTLLGCKATNISLFCDTIYVTDGSAVFYDSEIAGKKEISGDATIDFNRSTSNGGDVELNDTSIANIYYGSIIDDDIIQNDPTTSINDYRSAYAEIYYADASTAQTIPTGTTYTKWTAFTSNGAYNQCTADAANDKITITEAGTYYIIGNFSSFCGTDSVVARTALFVDNAEVSKIHKIDTFSTQNASQSGSISGIITVSEADVPVDIDVRVRHDNVGNVDFTGIYGNLSVYKIGY